MANEVKILINSVDNTSKVMSGIKGSFTEFNNALETVEKVLGYVDKAFDATVGQFTKYAEEVEDLSRVTGMTADETSRLIQVADDLFVDFGVLKTAARQMAKDGLVPNIDTLAKLSDQYLAFTDKNEQAAWAVKTFGRNYGEMTKILEAGGAALKEAAANQPGGLILSEQDLQNAKEYKQALDQMNDMFQALAISIGKEVVPALTEFLNLTYRLINLGNNQFDVYSAINGQLVELANTTDDYNTYKRQALGIINVALTAETKEHQITSAQADALTFQAEAAWKARDAKEALTDATGYAAIGYDAEAEALASQQEKIDATNEAYERTHITLNDLNGVMGAGYFSVLQYTAAHDQLRGALTEEEKAAKKAADAVGDDLAKAYEKLQTAQQNWNTTVGEDAAASLKEMSKNAGLVSQGLGAIDEVFGTNTLARQEYETAIETINKEFVKTKDVDEYKASLQTLADTFETSLAKDIGIAEVAIVSLQTKYDKLRESPPIHIPVNIDVTYPNGPIPSQAGGNPVPNPVPGGGENIPLPPNKRFSGGGTVINMKVYPASVSAAHAAIAAVLAQAQNKSINDRMSVG